MARVHTIICGVAMSALIPLSACSSDGRVAMSGAAFGGAPSGGSASEGSDEPPAAGPQSDGEGAQQTEAPALASAGNLADPIFDSDAKREGDDLASSYSRVTVTDASVGNEAGETSTIGLSAASDEQAEGEYATLGVLSGGEVVTADTGATSGGDLIGANANDEQVIGESDGQAIGVGALSSENEPGDVAGINVLSGDETADVQVNGAATSILDDATGALGDLDGGGD